MSDQMDPTQNNYKINMSSEHLKNSYFLKKKKKPNNSEHFLFFYEEPMLFVFSGSALKVII